MDQSDLFYTLALLRVEGIGDITAKKLLQQCGTAKNIFEEKPHKLQKIDGIGQITLSKLADTSVFEAAEKELKFIETENIKVQYFQDALYPERLKHCIDAPVLLFSSGNISIDNQPIISIVGTRNMTSYGNSFLKTFIEEIAVFKPIIVSGFAYGVDIHAHTEAMEHNLQTIGVLAHGLNQIYPATHKKHVAKMEQNGGFLTEFWSVSKPDKENFLKRNRIVAGISEATIVIESAYKGGSLSTANLANDYNREVFAVPGRTTDKYSEGCNNLIKTQKAHVIQSAADLVYMLNWKLETDKKKKTVQKQLFVNLEPDEQIVFNFLQQNGKELFDTIALSCEIPVYKLSSLMVTMELKGVIRPLPGKLFEVI